MDRSARTSAPPSRHEAQAARRIALGPRTVVETDVKALRPADAAFALQITLRGLAELQDNDVIGSVVVGSERCVPTEDVVKRVVGRPAAVAVVGRMLERRFAAPAPKSDDAPPRTLESVLGELLSDRPVVRDE